MQASETIQIGIDHYVPVMPTDESQADKGIDHPLVSCNDCNIAWRSHAASRCPNCARCVGFHFILHEDEVRDLMEAVSYLEDATFHAETERMTCEFRNLLKKHATWYDTNSRVVIQACYVTLLQRDPHPNVAYAIAFFRAEYEEAPEDEWMYIPNDEGEDDKYYTYWENSLYDEMMPS